MNSFQRLPFSNIRIRICSAIRNTQPILYKFLLRISALNRSYFSIMLVFLIDYQRNQIVYFHILPWPITKKEVLNYKTLSILMTHTMLELLTIRYKLIYHKASKLKEHFCDILLFLSFSPI